MPTNDDLYKKLADDYTARYGQELLNEMAYLEQFPGVTISEMNVDRRVRKYLSAKKRKRYMPIVATLAACFVLAFIFIIPTLLGYDINFLDINDESIRVPDVAHEAPAPEAPAPAAEAPAPAEEPTDDADIDFDFAHDDDESALVMEEPPSEEPMPPAPDDMPAPDMYAIIPLTVSLPDGFTQTDFDIDQGISIYFIEDRYRDDVVITLKRADMPANMSNMTQINLGGLTAFGIQTDAFSLLTFSRDGVLYTLTSQYDINTLIRLGTAFV